MYYVEYKIMRDKKLDSVNGPFIRCTGDFGRNSACLVYTQGDVLSLVVKVLKVCEFQMHVYELEERGLPAIDVAILLLQCL